MDVYLPLAVFGAVAFGVWLVMDLLTSNRGTLPPIGTTEESLFGSLMPVQPVRVENTVDLTSVPRLAATGRRHDCAGRLCGGSSGKWIRRIWTPARRSGNSAANSQTRRNAQGMARQPTKGKRRTRILVERPLRARKCARSRSNPTKLSIRTTVTTRVPFIRAPTAAAPWSVSGRSV